MDGRAVSTSHTSIVCTLYRLFRGGRRVVGRIRNDALFPKRGKWKALQFGSDIMSGASGGKILPGASMPSSTEPPFTEKERAWPHSGLCLSGKALRGSERRGETENSYLPTLARRRQMGNKVTTRLSVELSTGLQGLQTGMWTYQNKKGSVSTLCAM